MEKYVQVKLCGDPLLEAVPFSKSTETTIGNWNFKCEPKAVDLSQIIHTNIIIVALTTIMNII